MDATAVGGLRPSSVALHCSTQLSSPLSSYLSSLELSSLLSAFSCQVISVALHSSTQLSLPLSSLSLSAFLSQLHSVLFVFPLSYQQQITNYRCSDKEFIFVAVVISICYHFQHMGQFLQDGENSCFVSYYFKK